MAGPFDNLLEPVAIAAGENISAATMGDVAAMSLAISAKRIADALEKANEPQLEVCEAAPTAEELAKRPSYRIAAALETIAETLNAPQPGQCRICGCTYDNACDGGCGWADETRTLCDNEDCLRKAGVTP